MKTLILILICIVVSYFVGIATVLLHITKIDRNYKFAEKGSDFETIKQNLNYLGLDKILDCVHAYGYNAGWNDRQRVFDEEIDKMMNELSASTLNNETEN